MFYVFVGIIQKSHRRSWSKVGAGGTAAVMTMPPDPQQWLWITYIAQGYTCGAGEASRNEFLVPGRKEAGFPASRDKYDTTVEEP